MTKHHKSYNLEEIKLKIEQFCAYQDRCRSEVEQKLKPFNLSTEETQTLIDYLVDNKFIDEIRYVQSYTRGSYRYKKWGWNKIKANLNVKQVSSEYITYGYNEIDQTEYRDMIYAELKKKWPSVKGKSDFEKKNKLIRFGTGRGYEYDIISSFIESLEEVE